MSSTSMLHSVPLFAGLTEEELSFLADRLGKRAFGKGVIIFHEGSLGETLYIIEAGKVRIFALTESGQEISVNIYGQGEVFGELSVLDGLPRSAGAVAIEDTVCLTLQRDDLLQFLENCPRVALSIIRVLSARLRYTTQYAESLAFLDVCGWVAAKLLELGERYGVKRDGIEIELRLTQGELASWVGTSRESVNKVLRMFQGQGLIEVKDLKITLLDRRGLKRLIVY